MQLQPDDKKCKNLFSESSTELHQTTVRFSQETFSEIEELENQTGKARAFIIRRLVHKGLESVRGYSIE